MADNSTAIVPYVSPEAALKLRKADSGAEKNGSDKPPTQPGVDCPLKNKEWDIAVFASTTEPPLPSKLVIGVDFDDEGEFGEVARQQEDRTADFSLHGKGVHHGPAALLTPGWHPVGMPPRVSVPSDDNKTFELKIEKDPWIAIRLFQKQNGREVAIDGVTVKLKTPDAKTPEKLSPVALFEQLASGACEVTALTHDKFWTAAG